MPEVPEEEDNYVPPKPCSFRMNRAFMYYCTNCGHTEKQIDSGAEKCPWKEEEAKRAAKALADIYGGIGPYCI